MWLAHTDPLFKSLKTLKIHDLYTIQTAQFMYQYYHNQLPPDILDNDYFVTNKDIHHYNTRFSADYHIPMTNTRLAERTIKIQGALIWNSLHSSLKQLPSFSIFKRGFKDYLLSTYSETD